MKVGFIGAGAMGSAMIEGFIKSGFNNIIASVATNETKEKLEKKLHIEVFTDNKKIAEEVDIIFIAVKPYLVKKVALDISSIIKENTIIVSVAASVNTSQLKELFKTDNIIRIMPNTTVKTCNGFISIVQSENKNIENTIISLLNRIARVKVIEEEKIHAYNAIAGCSPAFLYILIEAMSDAGVLMGIDRKTAIEVSSQVFKGVGAMVLESNKHPAELKDSVCTPGGLTIKGVETLEKNALRSGLIEPILESYYKSIDSEKNK